MAKNKKIMSQMNVVPFIDIVFVLLVIFIISSSTIYSDHNVNIPEMSSDQSSGNKNIEIVFVNEDNNITYKGDVLEIEDLSNQINKNELVRLGFDQNLKYRDVSIIIGKLKDEGYANISLVFEVK